MFSKSKYTVAVPTGATIREQLDGRSMTQKEFSARMGLSEKHISRLINGQVELTHDVALRLEAVLGVPASFWNNLEAIYREKLARVEAENDLEQDAEFVSVFPYSKMAELQWVPATKIKVERINHLKNFFEVAKLYLIKELHSEFEILPPYKKGFNQMIDLLTGDDIVRTNRLSLQDLLKKIKVDSETFKKMKVRYHLYD
jgi:addiction module HigA family antidote